MSREYPGNLILDGWGSHSPPRVSPMQVPPSRGSLNSSGPGVVIGMSERALDTWRDRHERRSVARAGLRRHASEGMIQLDHKLISCALGVAALVEIPRAAIFWPRSFSGQDGRASRHRQQERSTKLDFILRNCWPAMASSAGRRQALFGLRRADGDGTGMAVRHRVERRTTQFNREAAGSRAVWSPVRRSPRRDSRGTREARLAGPRAAYEGEYGLCRRISARVMKRAISPLPCAISAPPGKR